MNFSAHSHTISARLCLGVFLLFAGVSSRAFGQAEVVVDFQKAEITGRWVDSWEEKGVVFTPAHAPTKSKAKARLMFFPHAPSGRKGILSALADDPIPVRASFTNGCASATFSFWGSTDSPARLEAYNAEGQLLDKAGLEKIPGRKAPGEPIPTFELTVKGSNIAYIDFSGPRAGEYLVAEEVRFVPLLPAAKQAEAAIPAARLPLSQNHAASERMFNSLKTPLPPHHIIGNIYYVGPAGVSSWLVTTPEGHILIDSTFEDCVPQICANIEKLGFRVGDIKLLLSSHAHVDHVGGHAAMKQRTGAQIVTSAADAHLMETGGADDFSPFPKDLLAYTPVKADRIVKDGETVSLGGVTLTMHLTPGHTKGATTWTMPLEDGGHTYQVLFLSSLSIAEPTSLLNNTNYPAIADDYAATFKKLKTLPCDIFLAPHADQFGLAEKLKRLDQGANPFIDPDSWKKFLVNAEKGYLKQIEAEKAAEPNRR
jgi:metallo-beta-lactamase class B